MVHYGWDGLISIIREVKDIYDKYDEDDNETKIKNAERSLINDTYKVLLRKVEPEIEDLTPKYLSENFSPEYITAITKSINDLVSSQEQYFSLRHPELYPKKMSRGGKRSKRKTNKKSRKHRKSRKTRK